MKISRELESLKTIPLQAWVIPVVAGVAAHGVIGLAGLLIGSMSKPGFWGPTDQQVAITAVGGCVLWILQCLVNISIGFLFVRLAAAVELETKHLIAGSSLVAFLAFVPLSFVLGLLSALSQGAGVSFFSSRPTTAALILGLSLGLLLNTAFALGLGSLGGYLGIKILGQTRSSAAQVGEPGAQADG